MQNHKMWLLYISILLNNITTMLYQQQRQTLRNKTAIH